MQLPKVSSYKKQQSFEIFHSNIASSIPDQMKRSVSAIKRALETPAALKPEYPEVLKQCLEELTELDDETRSFRFTQFLADEVSRIDDALLARYWFHRYRYEAYPRKKVLDAFPPCIQLEVSSICNYKCVFCYQTDPAFRNKASGIMGTIASTLFQKVVDEVDGKVDFITIASRGEPTVNRELPHLLKHAKGRFIGLKLNTNASLLNDDLIRALLSSDLQMLVFSADAADRETYPKYRVGGDFDKVMKNISRFAEIRKTEYPNSKLITRVSGVKVSDEQSLESMILAWGPHVDQIAFVTYNPWENIYSADPNGQVKPCSDLWRRMFVWFDGKANPCDSDYKSMLTFGNAKDATIENLWKSERYNLLRQGHLGGARQVIEPCKRCAVI